MSKSVFTGTPIGYADTINGSGVALSGIDCSVGRAPGTKCWVAAGTSYWTLRVSAAAVDHTTVETALGNSTLRWIIDAIQTSA